MLKYSKMELPKKVIWALLKSLSCVSWRAKTAAEAGRLHSFGLQALYDDPVPIPKVHPANRVKLAMLTE